MQNGTITWQIPIKLNVHLLNDQAMPLLAIFSREMKIYVHKKTCTGVFTAVSFIVTPNWKQIFNCM